MMSGPEPDCRAVITCCGRPLLVVICSLMLMSGLALWKSSASFCARSWLQLGVHHTTSPAMATDGTSINVETATPPASLSSFMSFLPCGRSRRDGPGGLAPGLADSSHLNNVSSRARMRLLRQAVNRSYLRRLAGLACHSISELRLCKTICYPRLFQ